MKRFIAAAAALLLLCLPLSGCLGAVQADDYIYVVGIGFDRGKSYRYNVSFLVQMSGDSDSKTAKGGGEVLAAEGDSLFDAINLIYAGEPRRMNFSRVSTMFFSEGLARDGSMSELAVTAFNYIKLRQSMKLVVCLGEAKTLMQGMCLPNTPNITKLQYSVFQKYAVEGITAITNYSLLMESIRGRRSDIVMMLGAVDPSAVNVQKKESREVSGDELDSEGNKGGSQSEQRDEGPGGSTTAGVERIGGMSSYIAGVALFDGWYMKGVLNGRDTRYLLMATGSYRRGNIAVPYLDTTATLYVKNDGPARIKLKLGNAPKAEVDISMSCNILQFLGDARNKEWEMGLKDASEKYIENELRRVFEICRGLNSDAMGFGAYASRQFRSAVEWEEYDWKAAYKNMDADFRVTLKLEDENLTTILE